MAGALEAAAAWGTSGLAAAEPEAVPWFSSSNCFVAGTPVQMADGTTKPIEQVKVGDQVLSKDQHATADKDAQDNLKGVSTHKVVRTFVHEQAHTLTLRLETGETITATLGHPFFVEGKGWTLAGQLAIGNAIVTRAGPVVRIADIEPGGEATVYNFEVQGDHTYFVGVANGGTWVHNDCTPADPNLFYLVDHNVPKYGPVARSLVDAEYQAASVLNHFKNVAIKDEQIIEELNAQFGEGWRVITKDVTKGGFPPEKIIRVDGNAIRTAGDVIKRLVDVHGFKIP